ncbi:MAG: tRNA (5-methylaminomethyl-2-thiouridine)(34)-methyltransferase MnmD [Cytophagales bacterium]|nr:tRNA (5-methylaminomethyl-2-thiouridine)(34)-methyltransferase MnmD [Cytophagales bacterium]
MPDPQPKIIVTEDGSHTLYMESIHETYHSFHGAWQESDHVFVKAGLDYVIRSNPHRPINLLEIGFGTGLNALLTMLNVFNKNYAINYHGLEPFPLDPELIKNLNYIDFLENPHEVELFQRLHSSNWDIPVAIMDNFILYKHKITLQAYQPSLAFELIYFDAFAPGKQPELWTRDVIKKVTDLLVPGGILVTYCARGQFKRDLAMLGLKVETLNGPRGKKEMVRAVRN